jgi:hypothetical protein
MPTSAFVQYNQNQWFQNFFWPPLPWFHKLIPIVPALPYKNHSSKQQFA